MAKKTTYGSRAKMTLQQRSNAGEDLLFPRRDWKLERDNCDTTLGYWEWVEHVRQEADSLRHYAPQYQSALRAVVQPHTTPRSLFEELSPEWGESIDSEAVHG